jgi:hypothetical protein
MKYSARVPLCSLKLQLRPLLRADEESYPRLSSDLDAGFRLFTDLCCQGERFLYGRAVRSQNHRDKLAGLGAGTDR